MAHHDMDDERRHATDDPGRRSERERETGVRDEELAGLGGAASALPAASFATGGSGVDPQAGLTDHDQPAEGGREEAEE